MFVQGADVANLAKIDEVHTRLVQYDMKRIFCVAPLLPDVDPTACTHVADLWDDGEIDMFESWDSIPFETVLYWQYSINKRCLADDKTSNQWAFQFLYNSCTSDLRDQINLKYKGLPIVFHGAVAYCWIIFHILFATSRDTTTALLKYLSIWKSKGLRRIKGENVVTASKELMAACRRLHATGHLPDEATADIISGFEKGSCTAFTEIFGDMRKDHVKETLKRGTALAPDPDRTLSEIVTTIGMAVDLYHNLSTANAWNIPKNHKFSNLTGDPGGSTRKCWNCGDPDHVINDCTKPRDEEKIKKNREEHFSNQNGGRTCFLRRNSNLEVLEKFLLS
jgi:hypothetical protein